MDAYIKKRLENVRKRVKRQSDFWWNLIFTDKDDTPWTDDDQIEIDDIISTYESIIRDIQNNNKKDAH